MTRQDTALHALPVGLVTRLFVLQPLGDLGWMPGRLPLLVTGFGDIAPAAPLARTLVTLQAVIGQIFIAVLLARLVSLELTGRGARRDG